MWDKIYAYLSFTRKERLGVLMLLAVVLILFVVPYFVRPRVGEPDPQAFQQYQSAIRKFRSGGKPAASEREPAEMDGFDNVKAAATAFTGEAAGAAPEAAFRKDRPGFYFDPNLVSEEGWHRLGLPDRLIRTILRYIQKGGNFHRAEDLKKIYGLRGEDYERIFPFVRIKTVVPESYGHSSGARFAGAGTSKAEGKYRDSGIRKKADGRWYPSREPLFIRKTTDSLDINGADSSAWCGLPGIGIRLACRIVHFREKLGGFYAVDQIRETFGLPDSSFQKIRPFLRLGEGGLQRIDLNTALPESLQRHPYIRWKLAQGILRYRDQHGGFKSVDEVQQLAQMDPENFNRLAPYLQVK